MEKIISEAREMRTKYLASCTGSRQPVAINTKKFATVVEEETGYGVESLVINDMEHLRGMIVRFPQKKAIIFVSDHNNDCWRRFTFIKEISHLFIETTPECFNSDAYEQAKALVDQFQTPDDVSPASEKLLHAEVSGIVAAMEIMIPDELIPYVAHLSNVDKMLPYAIASRLKVPQKYLEYKMRQHGIAINSPSS